MRQPEKHRGRRRDETYVTALCEVSARDARARTNAGDALESYLGVLLERAIANAPRRSQQAARDSRVLVNPPCHLRTARTHNQRGALSPPEICTSTAPRHLYKRPGIDTGCQGSQARSRWARGGRQLGTSSERARTPSHIGPGARTLERTSLWVSAGGRYERESGSKDARGGRLKRTTGRATGLCAARSVVAPSCSRPQLRARTIVETARTMLSAVLRTPFFV